MRAGPPRQFLAGGLLGLAIIMARCAIPSGLVVHFPGKYVSGTFLDFAREEKVEYIFAPETVQNLTRHPASGLLSLMKALEIIIEETGLNIHKEPYADAIAVRKTTKS